MRSGNPSDKARCRREMREFERVRLYVPGQLFIPSEDRTFDCKVLDLSAGGAAVQCAGSFARGDRFVLYVSGFGRFEGSVVLYEKEVLRLVFVIGKSKQNRLKDMLKSFADEGLTGVTELRKHKRGSSIGAGFAILADGRNLRCDVLNVSLEGASLRTKARPPIGEMINFGCNWGKVVRHHDEGIAIQFVKVATPDAA